MDSKRSNNTNPENENHRSTNSIGQGKAYVPFERKESSNGFGKYINTYSTGCLTSLMPKYMPYNQHTHGFAMVEINDGESKVKIIDIKDGKIV
jgi:hypothetical protein